MRVAIDLSSAAKPHPTGIGRYQVELVRAMAPMLTHCDRLLPAIRLKRWRGRRHLSSLPGLPHTEGFCLFPGAVDIYHSAAIDRARGVRTLWAVTVHDTATIDAPMLTSPGFAASHGARIRSALARADYVFTVSEFVRERVLELEPSLEPGRVRVTYHGCNHLGLSPEPAPNDKATRTRYGLEGSRYVLFVGRLERRKNPEGLVRAFSAAISANDALLALVGEPGDANVAHAVAESKLGHRVRLIGRVPDDHLGALYRGAAAFAMPSFYEGFGIPVIESMRCGAPALVGARTSLPEIAGDAALMVDPDDTAQIAKGITRLLSDRQLAETSRARGLRRADDFTWEGCARSTLEGYRELLRMGRRQ